eukprot:1176648-Prorocentrum_minimum.AAC.4
MDKNGGEEWWIPQRGETSLETLSPFLTLHQKAERALKRTGVVDNNAATKRSCGFVSPDYVEGREELQPIRAMRVTKILGLVYVRVSFRLGTPRYDGVSSSLFKRSVTSKVQQPNRKVYRAAALESLNDFFRERDLVLQLENRELLLTTIDSYTCSRKVSELPADKRLL